MSSSLSSSDAVVASAAPPDSSTSASHVAVDSAATVPTLPVAVPATQSPAATEPHVVQESIKPSIATSSPSSSASVEPRLLHDAAAQHVRNLSAQQQPQQQQPHTVLQTVTAWRQDRASSVDSQSVSLPHQQLLASPMTRAQPAPPSPSLKPLDMHAASLPVAQVAADVSGGHQLSALGGQVSHASSSIAATAGSRDQLGSDYEFVDHQLHQHESAAASADHLLEQQQHAASHHQPSKSFGAQMVASVSSVASILGNAINSMAAAPSPKFGPLNAVSAPRHVPSPQQQQPHPSSALQFQSSPRLPAFSLHDQPQHHQQYHQPQTQQSFVHPVQQVHGFAPLSSSSSTSRRSSPVISFNASPHLQHQNPNQPSTVLAAMPSLMLAGPLPFAQLGGGEGIIAAPTASLSSKHSSPVIGPMSSSGLPPLPHSARAAGTAGSALGTGMLLSSSPQQPSFLIQQQYMQQQQQQTGRAVPSSPQLRSTPPTNVASGASALASLSSFALGDNVLDQSQQQQHSSAGGSSQSQVGTSSPSPPLGAALRALLPNQPPYHTSPNSSMLSRSPQLQSTSPSGGSGGGSGGSGALNLPPPIFLSPAQQQQRRNSLVSPQQAQLQSQSQSQLQPHNFGQGELVESDVRREAQDDVTRFYAGLLPNVGQNKVRSCATK